MALSAVNFAPATCTAWPWSSNLKTSIPTCLCKVPAFYVHNIVFVGVAMATSVLYMDACFSQITLLKCHSCFSTTKMFIYNVINDMQGLENGIILRNCLDKYNSAASACHTPTPSCNGAHCISSLSGLRVMQTARVLQLRQETHQHDVAETRGRLTFD